MAARCVPGAARGACGAAIHPPGSAARGLPIPPRAWVGPDHPAYRPARPPPMSLPAATGRRDLQAQSARVRRITGMARSVFCS
jgi:hypothetical protein